LPEELSSFLDANAIKDYGQLGRTLKEDEGSAIAAYLLGSMPFLNR
jgi:hypothetical protein